MSSELLKISHEGCFNVIPPFSNDEFYFWKSFCEEVPTFLTSYLYQFRSYYQDCAVDIIEEHFNILHSSISCEDKKIQVPLLSHQKFTEFIQIMNQFIPEATYAQHFLFFLFANDLESWQLSVDHENNNKFVIHSSYLDTDKHTIPIQISLLSSLIQHEIMIRIYPQLSFLKQHNIDGTVNIEFITKGEKSPIINKDRIVKNKDDRHSKMQIVEKDNAIRTYFLYSHLDNSHKDGKVIDGGQSVSFFSNYLNNQEFLIKFITFNSLKNSLDASNLTKKIKNKI